MKKEELIVTLWLDEGDILLANNHWLLHGRTSFEDYSEPEEKRRLVRMWLKC
jgi:alpha-ketoglutarate-dependent taurine dioxygenase